MPRWAWALQLAVGLLQDIAPEIEKAAAAVASAGGDPAPHQNATAAVSSAINNLTQAAAAVEPKP